MHRRPEKKRGLLPCAECLFCCFYMYVIMSLMWRRSFQTSSCSFWEVRLCDSQSCISWSQNIFLASRVLWCWYWRQVGFLTVRAFSCDLMNVDVLLCPRCSAEICGYLDGRACLDCSMYLGSRSAAFLGVRVKGEPPPASFAAAWSLLLLVLRALEGPRRALSRHLSRHWRC